jgi:hypothetical protein
LAAGVREPRSEWAHRAAIIYNCLELSRGFFICFASNCEWEGHLGEVMKTHIALALVTFCAALTPAVVRADSQDDQQACMADAFAVCGQFIPDREAVGSCLFANQRSISPACRAAIQSFNPRTAASTPAPARNKHIKAAAR